jgi:uncharacterized protein (TIGR02271 family)
METLELREERLSARKEPHEVGEVVVRTEVGEVPGRLELDAVHDEVEVEHVPIGSYVTERVAPWEEQGVLVMPVYEEQLVVTKRLLLREYVKVRKIPTSERRLFEEPLRRERLVIDQPEHANLVHERYTAAAEEDPDSGGHDEGGLVGKIVRKALQ